MTTTHVILHGDAGQLTAIADASVDLVVTSPPYPMIRMWDSTFAAQDERIGRALAAGDGPAAFRRMHDRLDAVWAEVCRVLKPGGYACVNVGDATRTVNGDFRLYSNHSRVLSSLDALGFVILPDILWRKQTNSPDKFLGSGVLPPGAYVTLEHEYILIARKGPRRVFATEEERRLRRESSFFWEERNTWFSDVWMDVKGAGQDLHAHDTRTRSAAFPLEIPYRLICMFSLKGDTVLDPFLGTGTTAVAALAAARHSIGCEIDAELCGIAGMGLAEAIPQARTCVESRIRAHLDFVARRKREGGNFAHRNRHYDLEVVTEPESDLCLEIPSVIREVSPGRYEASYSESAIPVGLNEWMAEARPIPRHVQPEPRPGRKRSRRDDPSTAAQETLF